MNWSRFSLALAVFIPQLAHAERALRLELGYGNLSFDQVNDYEIDYGNRRSTSDDSDLMFIGYKFDNNVFINIGKTEAKSSTVSYLKPAGPYQQLDLETQEVLLGFQLGRRTYYEPTVGIIRWDLQMREERPWELGGMTVYENDSGYGWVAGFTTGVRFSKTFSISTNYRYMQIGEANTKIAYLGFKLDL